MRRSLTSRFIWWGAVRNILLNYAVDDIDLAAALPPDKVIAALRSTPFSKSEQQKAVHIGDNKRRIPIRVYLFQNGQLQKVFIGRINRSLPKI